MSLIKKPGIEEFRDSATVRTVRGVRTVAASGGSALHMVRKAWLAMILLAFIGSGVGALFDADGIIEVLMILAIIGGAVAVLRWLFKPAARPDPTDVDNAWSPDHGVSVPLPDHLRVLPDGEALRVDYWPRALRDRAGPFILGGLGLATLTDGILLAIGVCLAGRGLLLAMPLFGDPACVRGNADGLTVHSLLGARTLEWRHVTTVRLHRLAWRDLSARLAAGTGTVLLVRGEDEFEATELLVPYPLLGLDNAGAKALAMRINACRANEGFAPEPRGQPGRVHAVPGAPAAAPSEPFDPDRMVERYLADRAAAARCADRPPVPRPSFGRKGVS